MSTLTPPTDPRGSKAVAIVATDKWKLFRDAEDRAHYEFSFKDAEYAEWLGGEAVEFDLPEPLRSRGLVGLRNPHVPPSVEVSYYAKHLGLADLRGRALIIRPCVGLNSEDRRIAEALVW